MHLGWIAFDVITTTIDIAFLFSIINIQLVLKDWVIKKYIFSYGTLIVVVTLIYNYFNQNDVSSIILMGLA